MESHEKSGCPTEYSCRLQLPCNAPFETLDGPVCSSMRLAQQVCVSLLFSITNFGIASFKSSFDAGCLLGCLQEAPPDGGIYGHALA